MTALSSLPRRGRPPKVARTHPDTREALLRVGMAIFTEQGFSATGIDAVLKQVQVPKGSFYHYFASKEAFGQEVLQNYAAYFAKKLDLWLLASDVPPLERLWNFVQDAKAGMTKYGFRRGCLVGNLGQEILVLPESFRAQLEAVLLDWQARLARCLTEAAENGTLHADTDCDAQAAFFWIGWEGAVLRARLAQNAAPLDIFIAGYLAGITR
ncbi:acrylate utilization transcriptional regulator AcuR [Pseudomonas sp. JBR1]|uniref:acrylate utilization transcriptional regulator AcuR n=1 Tax=Pseudomonas sp. JBR1 TaxID=3020907 RepID=UPI0023067435|nr:TetR/AcrR family transcriptional regulator [Pseudomonas sp. JBR1]WCE10202.1 TetR/AcrR family transcriptional regulator [Pseudomonas sp. JBR1]